jgi:hypothetical protein
VAAVGKLHKANKRSKVHKDKHESSASPIWEGGWSESGLDAKIPSTTDVSHRQSRVMMVLRLLDLLCMNQV